MKNLIIYVMDNDGRIKNDIWKDVKVTRDGKIVDKINSEYNLSHGKYKYNEKLDTPYIVGICVEYITFNDDLNINEIKELLTKPFIEAFNKSIEKINQEKEDFLKMVKKNEIINRY